ncbi:MAG: cytochrome-c peroxidase, partial [Epsilonproteobacteria bacterium]
MVDIKDYFEPIDHSVIDINKKKKLIALGKKLYLDKRLSVNDTISCNSCHLLDSFG